MMGYQGPPQGKLFYSHINMDQRVRPDHSLRKIVQFIDFEFVYKEVEASYGARGNVSVPPPIILKLMVLLVFYNVRSERELMETLAERLDWLWFLGYDLDTPIPDHSVLSKARRRWGVVVFKALFERVVWQCAQAGLIDGSKIFMDASLVEANASNTSVIDTQSLRRHLDERYKELEAGLTETEEEDREKRPYRTMNSRYVSATDPDAAIVRRGQSKLCYEVHRVVDPSHEVITATAATPGDVNEAHLLTSQVEAHRRNTARSADTVVADSKYGTIENFLACSDRGIRAHIPDLGGIATKRAAARGIFPETAFEYHPSSDTYRCPAGKLLRQRSFYRDRQSIEYAAAKSDCAACPMKADCTQNPAGRTVKRHLRQEALERMRILSRSRRSKRDLRIRQHLMERSFAQSTRYGFDRARWRGLWRVQIQEYLICAIQNIQTLIKYGYDPRRRPAVAVRPIERGRRPVIDGIGKVLFVLRAAFIKYPQNQNSICLTFSYN